jgi:serine protease DegQ
VSIGAVILHAFTHTLLQIQKLRIIFVMRNPKYAALTGAMLLGLLSFSFSASAALPAELNGKEVPSLAPLVDKTAPAVVNIRTRATISAPMNPLMEDPFFRRFFGAPEGGERQREVSSAGSGVIVDAAKGHILTNHHVVDNADEIEVFLQDNRILKATVIGSDPGTDIAVLKVEDPKDLTQMRLGNSAELRVGDYVVAIGNPFGLQHTVTSGIVSALGRRGINRDGYEDFIQTDASINPGNSGGALINLKGELIGINSAIYSQSGGNIGIGFAIPVNIAASIMQQILEFGEVKRGLLGVSISDLSPETAEAFGIESETFQGALVQEVFPDSPAETAGIEAGDVIVAVDGKNISGAGDLRTTIGLKRSGEEIQLELLRNGKQRKLRATLGSSESMAQTTDAVDIHPRLAGAEFSNYDGKKAYNGKGVQVDSVAPGSPAEFAGLEADDIIVQLNNRPVESVDDLEQLAEEQKVLGMKIVRGTRVLLRVIR